MTPDHVYEELSRYIYISPEDCERAVALKPLILGNFDDIADSIYRKQGNDPRTLSAYQSIERFKKHKESLRQWLEEAFSGIYDKAYYATRIENGRRHAEVALFPHFVFGKMAGIRTEVVDVIVKANFPQDELASYLETTNRIFDLDLAITIQSYWDSMMASKLKVPMALSSGIAHEVRNPLNGISLNLTLLERKLKKEAPEILQTQPLIASIQRELDRIGNLTTEIINFSKPLEIHPTFLDATDLLEDVVRLQSQPLAKAGVVCHSEVVGHPTMFADKNRIIQVMLNLIQNAIDAFPEECESKSIKISVSNVSGSTTSISIEDNGAGMRKEVVDKIFDLYFSTKSKGSGLGMPIVRKIVEAHYGMIRIDSKVGEGTRVSLYLPRPARAQSYNSTHAHHLNERAYSLQN